MRLAVKRLAVKKYAKKYLGKLFTNTIMRLHSQVSAQTGDDGLDDNVICPVFTRHYVEVWCVANPPKTLREDDVPFHEMPGEGHG